MGEFLTTEEIEELTRAKTPGKQAEILDRNGIYYILRMDKTIITTWHHVNHPRNAGSAINDSTPDFSKVI